MYEFINNSFYFNVQWNNILHLICLFNCTDSIVFVFFSGKANFWDEDNNLLNTDKYVC
jgi:hypothetical protein